MTIGYDDALAKLQQAAKKAVKLPEELLAEEEAKRKAKEEAEQKAKEEAAQRQKA